MKAGELMQGININQQVTDNLGQWMDVIVHPTIFIPLLFGLAVGFIVSVSPHVSRIQRHSDREFYIYITNGTVASVTFVLLNLDKMFVALQMVVFVFGSAVVIPWLFFFRVG